MSQVFTQASMEKKRAIVVAHYGESYKKEMKLRGIKIDFETLSDEKITELYKKLIRLTDDNDCHNLKIKSGKLIGSVDTLEKKP